MNRYQKSLLRHCLVVLALALVAAGAMFTLRDWINRSEAMRAMELLGSEIKNYKATNFSLPNKTILNNLKDKLPGASRLGPVQYRAVWIDYNTDDDEILAYVYNNFKSFLVKPGYVVLRLSGKTEWMGKEKFEKLLQQQQSPKELQLLQQTFEQRL